MNKVFEATDDLNELIGKYGFGIVKSAFSKIQEKEEADTNKILFSTSCEAYGLSPEHFNQIFRVGKETYRIKGIKPRNRKYPIIADRVKDGKGFKFTTEQVKLALPAK